MGGSSVRHPSIFHGRKVDQAVVHHFVITSLLLSSVLVCGIYLFIPSPVLRSNGTLPPVQFGRKSGKDNVLDLGRLETMMVKMVADDLPFTIFIPTRAAADRLVRSCLKTVGQETDVVDSVNRAFDKLLEMNSTKQTPQRSKTSEMTGRDAAFAGCLKAVASRVMSFSTVPKQVRSNMVPVGGEMEVESLSGYKLYLARDPSRGLVVNSYSCKITDINMGLLVVHILDGVLMDSSFEKSVDFEDNVLE